MSYDIFHTNGHYEVYINGEFYCSTDSMHEAAKEIENAKNKLGRGL